MCFLRGVFSIQVTNFVFHCPFINVWKIKTIQMTSTWNSWTLNHITAFHICWRNPKWKTSFFVQCWYFLFPERSGLTVCQFFVLSVVFFSHFLFFAFWSREAQLFLCYYRASRPEMLCKKVVLKNFAEFTGKHPSQSIFLIKNWRPSACNCI